MTKENIFKIFNGLNIIGDSIVEGEWTGLSRITHFTIEGDNQIIIDPKTTIFCFLNNILAIKKVYYVKPWEDAYILKTGEYKVLKEGKYHVVKEYENGLYHNSLGYINSFLAYSTITGIFGNSYRNS